MHCGQPIVVRLLFKANTATLTYSSFDVLGTQRALATDRSALQLQRVTPRHLTKVTLSPSLKYRPIQCELLPSLISMPVHLPIIVYLWGGQTVPGCDPA